MFQTQPTQFDLTFTLFGYHVRINPTFFILPLLFTRNLSSGFDNIGIAAVLVVGLYFVSILIHELGHSLAFTRYGIHSRIVLYMMGGYAIPEAGSWRSGRGHASLNSNQKMFVSFAGPLAGFLLAAALVLIGLAMGGTLFRFTVWYLPLPAIDLRETMFNNAPFNLLINGGIAINILLNLFNLLPVYPLDGGQITREFLTQQDPRDGQRNSLYLSMVVAIVLAVMGMMGKELFITLFFGMMAYNNYMMMQRFGGSPW